MDWLLEAQARAMTRRLFFSRTATGIGTAALASLLQEESQAETRQGNDPLGIRPSHFAAKAKRVIYLFQYGAPSHLDLFDYKPKLVDLTNKPIPEEFIKGQRFAFLRGTPNLVGTPFKFSPQGKSGTPLSELLPHLSTVADDIALVKSMHTDAFNHDPATTFMNTGSMISGRPSMGSWMTYGLGSESKDFPGFVVLLSGDGNQPVGSHHWGNGFLPSFYQGVQFRSKGDPVLSVSNPPGMSAKTRRRSLDALKDLNAMQVKAIGDPEILTRINSYEMAYRMQTSILDLMDISKEPQNVHEMYGTEPGKTSFANNCLLARRLVERGVRFVQLFHRDWDHHESLPTRLKARCLETDRPSAALIKDLKQRGLLEDTLVIWGGEFGRTPMIQGEMRATSFGRDHHPKAFSIWMAGGGVKPGITLGSTDELGYHAVEDKVHVHDFQATVLQLLGLDHTRLTYKFQGRDFRLTDVAGEVVKKLVG